MKVIIIIIAIVILEGYALYLGFNGAMLGLALVVLGGLGGYNLKAILKKR